MTEKIDWKKIKAALGVMSGRFDPEQSWVAEELDAGARYDNPSPRWVREKAESHVLGLLKRLAGDEGKNEGDT